MKEADFYVPLEDQKVRCHLCPHNCLIKEGRRGICGVRKNISGKLIAETYGEICSAGFDPIEKKPLYHFYPDSIIFSIGSIGCNLHCRFCQNWEISQSNRDEFNYLRKYEPGELVNIAENRKDNLGIAYTYNEPAVWYEYMKDIAVQAKKENLKNVMVTNGFISEKPLTESFEFIDAYGVDLKAFDEEFFRKLTASKLEPVKETLKTIRKSGKHLEITNLVITDENDEEKVFREMIDWIATELGPQTILHISRYYPVYKMQHDATSPETLNHFYEIASEKLSYVYLGNISSGNGQNTHCSKCHALVAERSRYNTHMLHITKEGNCEKCGNKIFIM